MIAKTKEEMTQVHSEDRREFKDCPEYVPMSLLSECWAQYNHGQTLRRLNERGGMSSLEIIANMDQVGLFGEELKKWKGQAAVDELKRRLQSLTPKI